jgi:spore germination protein YaaH
MSDPPADDPVADAWPPPHEPTPADVSGEAEPEREPRERRLTGRARLAMMAACAVLTVVAAGILVLSLRPDSAPPDRPGLDAWAPYWALDDSLPDLAARSGTIADLSPFWYKAERADSIVVDENASKAGTAAFLAAAQQAGIRLVPSVVDGTPSGAMAAVLADPTQRAIHVKALADFAAKGDFAGLDIDYEKFAFSDDRSSWATTRPSWVAFVTELAEQLHSDGRTLTVSIPPIYDSGRTSDSGYWVYDYAAITPLVDHIRVMAYDYSTSSPGPIAPLDWVQQSIDATAEASGDPSKLVLGLPLYGYNWVVATAGTCPTGQAEGRSTVTTRSADELAARRGATPIYDAVTGEWAFTYQLELSDGTTSCTQTREVHYIDSQGALARLALAEEAAFDGGSLWALGYEDEELWSGLSPAGATATSTLRARESGPL